MSQKLRTCFVGTVLSFCMGFASIACLVTGLNLSVNLWTVAIWCLLGGFLCSFCCNTKFGLIPLGIFVLLLGYFWQSGLLEKTFESLIFELSQSYYEAFGWNTIRWTGRSGEQMQKTLSLSVCLLGVLIAMVTGWSIAKGQSAVPAVMLAVIPVLLSMLVPDSSPKALWVAVLFFAMAMLMIGSTVRFDNEKQGNKLSFYTAIPVALSVALLFAMIPQKGYMGQERAQLWSEKLLNNSALMDGWKKLTGQEESAEELVSGVHVELDRLGSRHLSDAPMLTVKANYTGTLYLRGSVLDQYNGKTWTVSDDGTTLPWPEKTSLTSVGEVMISTRYAHRMLYLPYYVTSMNLEGVNRGIINEQKLNQYSFACSKMPTAQEFLQMYPDKYTNQHTFSQNYMAQAVELPEQTLAWADPLVRSIVGDTVNYYHKAQLIRDYVRTGAKYDLDPAVMGNVDQDFAQWFLEESHSGYCVHFATAATVLLRAAGIPARYATGYMVQVKEGESVAVLESNAHAWVEYWLPGFGWTVLEATPADSSEYIPPVTQTQTTTQDKTNIFAFLLTPWFWLGFVFMVPVALVAQWQIRRAVGKRKIKKGDRNDQMLSRWALLAKMHQHLDPPDEKCLALAEKARFSQHVITKEELEQMDLAICEAKYQLRNHNIFRRIYYALILALP